MKHIIALQLSKKLFIATSDGANTLYAFDALLATSEYFVEYHSTAIAGKEVPCV